MTPDPASPGSNSLDENETDHLALVLRALAGLTPFVGSVMAELTNAAMGEQRLDRIASYLKALAERVAGLESRFLEQLGERGVFVDLLEESIRQAVRSTSEERRLYLANLIKNGLIYDGQQDYLLTRFLLRLLDQINEPEVVILKWYRGDSRRDEIEAQYPSLVPFYQSTENVIRVAYHNHLADLGLLRRIFRTAHAVGSGSSEVEVDHLEIMPLGQRLLDYITN